MKKAILFVLAIILAVILLKPSLLPIIPASLAEQIQQLTIDKFPFTVNSELGLSNILVLVLMLALVYVVSTILKALVKFVGKKDSRTQTVSELLVNVIQYGAAIVAVCWGLSILGVNVAAIFASLGIIGLVIGFGAQSLIEDIITGMFIIFEGQYAIGDIIVLDDFRGTVKRIGVRTTTIEDTGGNLKVVNNSDIRNFQNRSKNTSLAIVVCDVAYETDIAEAENKFMPELEALLEQHKDLYLAAPAYLGVDDLGASGVTLKFKVACTEENIFAAQRALRRDIKIIFDKHGIQIPFPQVVVHNGD